MSENLDDKAPSYHTSDGALISEAISLEVERVEGLAVSTIKRNGEATCSRIAGMRIILTEADGAQTFFDMTSEAYHAYFGMAARMAVDA